jgi:hydrogenase maturation protease
MSNSLLILGLGNVLLRDDGVGAAAVARLIDEYEPPPSVRVLDGGTLGLALLPYVEDASSVVLVDAVQADAPPGTLVRLERDEVGPAVATRLSPHQIGVADLLDGAQWRDRYPSRVLLLGIVPESLDLEVGLSPSVRAALPALVECVVEEARACGFEISRRANVQRVDADGCALDVARLAGMR